MERWRDLILMSTRDRVLVRLPGVQSDLLKGQVDTLLQNYSRRFMDYMDRKIVYRERTEYFDVAEDYPIIKLAAWPIGLDATPEPLVEIFNDNSASPTYTTALTYQDDYRVYTDEDHQGKIKFRSPLLHGAQALKIVWTGGMATKTIITEADGVTANGPPRTLDSALATFEDDLVEVGMTVTVGNDTREITAVVSQTQLEVDADWTSPGSGQTYVVNEAGFVGAYEEIEEALIDQIVFHWKRRDKLDVKAMGVQGGTGVNTTYMDLHPLRLMDGVIDVLHNFRRIQYP